MVVRPSRPVTGRLVLRTSSVPACRLMVKLVLYEVVSVAILTSAYRCWAARMASHCASVGLPGLFWLCHTLYGLLWVASTVYWVTNTVLPDRAAGRLLM